MQYLESEVPKWFRGAYNIGRYVAPDEIILPAAGAAGLVGLAATEAAVLGYGGIKAAYRKAKNRELLRKIRWNPTDTVRKLDFLDKTASVDPSSTDISSISNMEPYSRDGGSWYQTRARRVGRRKPISSGKITRALTEMQTFSLGVATDFTTGVTATNDATSLPGLYREWDPGRPCAINLENTVETVSAPTGAANSQYLPMHLYDLSWAPVKTNRGAAGSEAVDHYDGANHTLNPENFTHVMTFDGLNNSFRWRHNVGGVFYPRALHKSTDDDVALDTDVNYNINAVNNFNCQNIRWVERAHKNGPPSFSETYGPKVYNKSLTIKYNVAGTRSTPTKVELRIIKFTTPWMHPLYSEEYGARGTEEQAFFNAEWSRMIRGMCINPLARGELPQPVPGMKHKWFKTLAKKVINFPEASADRGTIPMVSGQFHININQLQDHAWKQQGRGEAQGVDPFLAYDAVPTVSTLDYGTYTMSQKPWFTNRIMLLVRAVVPHQFRLQRNVAENGNVGMDTSVNQVDNLEGNGQRYEEGHPADADNAMDGDLNNDGLSNQQDYNIYLKNFCPSYELNIRKSFVSINDFMGLPGGGPTTSAH